MSKQYFNGKKIIQTNQRKYFIYWSLVVKVADRLNDDNFEIIWVQMKEASSLWNGGALLNGIYNTMWIEKHFGKRLYIM